MNLGEIVEVKASNKKTIGQILIAGKDAAYGWPEFVRPRDVALGTNLVRYRKALGAPDAVSSWKPDSEIEIGEFLSIVLQGGLWYKQN